MKTRAQRREQAIKNEGSTKKKKKEVIQEKVEAKAKGKGKGMGSKKVKLDSVEASPPAKDSKLRKSERSRSKDARRISAGKSKEKEEADNQGKNLKRTASAASNKKTNTSAEKPEKQAKEQKGQKKEEKKRVKQVEASQDEQKEKVKKIQFKGKVPIDEYCTLSKNANFHVLEHGGKVYSATLNQTSVTNNNNKFYVLQIIQNSNSENCYFFTRWGRVGVPGQQSCINANISTAIRLYNSKYNDKFHKGNYREIQLNYGNEDQEEEQKDENKKRQQRKKKTDSGDKQKQFAKSSLPLPVKRLIELIFDINMMNQQMKEIGYNVSKMPLGKLSKDSIKLGFEILKKLSDEVKKKSPNRREIQSLTDDFYSYIPHDFGFSNMAHHILDNVEKVKYKIQMLESLSEIKVATKLLSSSEEDENRLDANYKKLNREITAIDKQSQTFNLINRYMQTTHASTHNIYTLDLEDLFQINTEFQNVRYTKEINNKMLLWHGSRLTNFVGILSQGLRIAPPEAPVTGYMFGKGVYFADMCSKSANYCCTSRQNPTGILLLCEVALGEMNEKLHADYYAANLPPGMNSTKGVGRTAPDPQNAVTKDGVAIPMGPGVATNVSGAHLLYNEFIVYDIAQIRIKYLLRTRFNYRK